MRRPPQPPLPSLFASAPMDGGPVAPQDPPAPDPSPVAAPPSRSDRDGPAAPPAFALEAEVLDEGGLADDENPFHLRPREELFVTAYLGVALGNATKAFELAGYSLVGAGATVRNNAAKVLRRPHVKSAVIARRRALRAVLDGAMERDEALRRISVIARADARQVWAHEPLIVAMPDHVAACIKGVVRTEQGLRIDLYDRVHALEVIGKWRGMAAERLDVTLTHRLEDILAESRKLPPAPDDPPVLEAVAS